MPYDKLPKGRLPAEEHSEIDLADGLNLHDDLLCLAEQLSVDADRLAEVYPAASPETWLCASEGRDRSRTHRAGMRWRIAAAVVFVAGGISIWGWLNRTNLNELATVQSPALGSAESAVGSPAVAGDASATPAAGISAVLFQSLSSPEQEALLDLMDSEGIEQSSLSI